jgi:hypothetical protein
MPHFPENNDSSGRSLFDTRSHNPHSSTFSRRQRNSTHVETVPNPSASYIFVGDATRADVNDENTMRFRTGDIMAINRDGDSILCLRSGADDPPARPPFVRRFDISRDSRNPTGAVCSFVSRDEAQLTNVDEHRQVRQRPRVFDRASGPLVARCLPDGQFPSGAGNWSHVLGGPGRSHIWIKGAGEYDDWELGPVTVREAQLPPEISILPSLDDDQ